MYISDVSDYYVKCVQHSCIVFKLPEYLRFPIYRYGIFRILIKASSDITETSVSTLIAHIPIRFIRLQPGHSIADTEPPFIKVEYPSPKVCLVASFHYSPNHPVIEKNIKVRWHFLYKTNSCFSASGTMNRISRFHAPEEKEKILQRIPFRSRQPA